MSAMLRWILFFTLIVTSLGAVYAIWAGGVTEELVKVFVSFAILMLASVGLFLVARSDAS